MSEVAAGSQTAVISTEHTLSTQTSFGTYQLLVDLSNMVNGDVLEVRIKAKARNAASAAVQGFLGKYANAQPFPLVLSIPFPASNWVATLKQTAGTGRAFEWSVNSP